MQPTNPQPGGAGQPEPQQPQDLYRPAQTPQTPMQPAVLPAPIVVPQTQPALPPSAASRPEGFVPTNDSVEWEASEYMQRNKDIVWIIGFATVTILLLGLAVWTKSWSFALLIVAMAAIIGFYGFRKPRVLQYKITHEGVAIGDKLYAYSTFRAFGVHDDEAFYSVMLLPVKRLMPMVRMYFAEDDGERIVDLLNEHLPMEEMPDDPFEKIMRRLHF